MLDPKSQRIGNSGRRFGLGAAEGTGDRLAGTQHDQCLGLL
jgi:hypothetical protein